MKDHKVFVSSTSDDLLEHREFVIDQLRKSGYGVDAMEDWTAGAENPRDFCFKLVRGCDLLVLLVAWRRGFIPEGTSKGNPFRPRHCLQSKV